MIVFVSVISGAFADNCADAVDPLLISCGFLKLSFSIAFYYQSLKISYSVQNG